MGGTIRIRYPIGAPIDTLIAITKRQKQILQRIVTENMISRRKFSDNLGINESAVKKHLNALKNKGVLKRIGGTRGHWDMVLEENNEI